ALVRRDGCEHLILIGPDGQMVVESGILPSIPSDGAAAVGTAMAGEAIAQTVVPEMAAPEREGQASEPTPGNSKDAIVSDETAPEPETEL
ncbi:hypothetical protein ACO1LU_14385, partial [Staphylococcus aureus]